MRAQTKVRLCAPLPLLTCGKFPVSVAPRCLTARGGAQRWTCEADVRHIYALKKKKGIFCDLKKGNHSVFLLEWCSLSVANLSDFRSRHRRLGRAPAEHRQRSPRPYLAGHVRLKHGASLWGSEVISRRTEPRVCCLTRRCRGCWGEKSHCSSGGDPGATKTPPPLHLVLLSQSPDSPG